MKGSAAAPIGENPAMDMKQNLAQAHAVETAFEQTKS